MVVVEIIIFDLSLQWVNPGSRGKHELVRKIRPLLRTLSTYYVELCSQGMISTATDKEENQDQCQDMRGANLTTVGSTIIGSTTVGPRHSSVGRA